MLDWRTKIPERVLTLRPSGIRKFFDIVGTMPGAISLGVGEPDFVTPYEIRQEAVRSIQRGETQYTPNRGLLELREEIALYLKTRFGLQYDPRKEIVVTVGGSEAIDITLRALLTAGDEMIIPDPSFVAYEPLVTLSGAKPISCPVTALDGFKLRAEELEKLITSRTKAILVSYPNNPTGAVMTKAELEPIAALAAKHNLVVISDEIYAELSYDEPFTSIASLPEMRERTIVVSGFSKAFAMTGWRVGYLTAPAEAVEVLNKIHQYIIMCAPNVSQRAAIAALKAGRQDGYASILEMKEAYDRRRRLMYDAFQKMGLDCYEPHGAFYEFPSVKSLGMTGDEFAESLIKSHGVAVVPGSAFGSFGTDHIRCCYAVSVNDLNRAFDRMNDFIQKVKATR